MQRQRCVALLGPFSYSPSNCTDYDVWTGRIAHHRVYLDQGTWAGTGSRELAYTTGWTMDDAFPSMTWYEFVTYRIGQTSADPQFKCTADERGTNGTTTALTCDFDHDW